MDYAKFKQLIPLFLDGQLEDTEMKEVRSFLASHPEAEQELKAYEQTWDMLGEWKSIEPNPGYVSRFWTELSLRKPWHEKVLESVRENILSHQLVPVLATACIILVIGTFSIRQYSQTQQSEQILASLSEDDLELVEYIELAENYDVIEDIEFLDDLDIIENLDALESLS